MDSISGDDVAALAPPLETRAPQTVIAHALRAWDWRNPPEPAHGTHGIFHRALEGLRACVPGGATYDLYQAGRAHAEAALDPVLDHRDLGVRI